MECGRGGYGGKDIFFFKQKTAYEIVSRDWSSDVCSSDLLLISNGADVNTSDNEGKTLLDLALEKNHSPMIELIQNYF